MDMDLENEGLEDVNRGDGSESTRDQVSRRSSRRTPSSTQAIRGSSSLTTELCTLIRRSLAFSFRWSSRRFLHTAVLKAMKEQTCWRRRARLCHQFQIWTGKFLPRRFAIESEPPRPLRLLPPGERAASPALSLVLRRRKYKVC